MKSNIFKKAHELTKTIIKKGDNYRATFRLCLSFVYSQIKNGGNKMEYKTTNGASVKVELEGSKISNLVVNGIEVVTKITEQVFISTFDNTIVLNSNLYFKKLGAKSIVRIEASKELIEAFKIASKEERDEEERKLNEKFNWDTVTNLDYNFEKHMNDVNN